MAGAKGKGGAAVVWCLLLAGLLFLLLATVASAEAVESGSRGGDSKDTKEARRWCKKDCEWKKDQCMHECRQARQCGGGGSGEDEKQQEEEDDEGSRSFYSDDRQAADKCRAGCQQRFGPGYQKEKCMQECKKRPHHGGGGRDRGDERERDTVAGAVLSEV
ncbi:hypothetical protein BRADI_4g15240v3 [Brachypodium distachyon]|uniref:Uncharacterized protein n=1 Tax=Brachypodium distachyon TaxID=15368 RepID=I1IKU9_BRADI|nr:hypothetical protein BRADI_4g15240v3 [Brachypodium distachyon]